MIPEGLTLENFDPLLISVLLLTVLVLLQSLFLMATLFQANRQLRFLERVVPPLLRAAAEGLTSIQGVLIRIKALAGEPSTLQVKVASTLRTVREAATRGSHTLERAFAFSQSLLQAASNRAGGVLNQFSLKTFTVHQAVLRPLREIAATLRAGHVALTHLFPRNK